MLLLSGLTAAVYGLWLAWPPLGWIVGGCGLMAVGLWTEIGDRT